MKPINVIKFIGIFLLVLLGIFVLYGIYYGVIFYLFFIKLAFIAALVAWGFWMYFKAKKRLQ
jgi:hypothetical protein